MKRSKRWKLAIQRTIEIRTTDVISFWNGTKQAKSSDHAQNTRGCQALNYDNNNRSSLFLLLFLLTVICAVVIGGLILVASQFSIPPQH